MREAVITNTDPLSVTFNKTEGSMPVAFSSVRAEDLEVNDEVVVEVIDRRVFLLGLSGGSEGGGEPGDGTIEFRHLGEEFWDVLEEGQERVRLAQAGLYEAWDDLEDLVQAKHIDTLSIAASEAVVFDLTAQNAVINSSLWVESMQAHKIDADQITTGTLSANRIDVGSINVNSLDGNTITAYNISGVTITGTTIAGSTLSTTVSSSSSRVELGKNHSGTGMETANIAFFRGSSKVFEIETHPQAFSVQTFGTIEFVGTVWIHGTLNGVSASDVGAATSGHGHSQLHSHSGTVLTTINHGSTSGEGHGQDYIRNPSNEHWRTANTSDGHYILRTAQTGIKFLNSTNGSQTRNGADTTYRNHAASDFIEGSDIRFKSNVQEFSDKALEKVRDCLPKSFVYEEDTRNRLGFVAGEVPSEAYLEDDQGMGAFSHSAMLALLWKAVSELAQEVDELKSQAKGE